MNIKLNAITNYSVYSFHKKFYSPFQNKIIGVAILALTAFASSLLTMWFLKSKFKPVENISEKSTASQDIAKIHLDIKNSKVKAVTPISNPSNNQSNIQIQPSPKHQTPKKCEIKSGELNAKTTSHEPIKQFSKKSKEKRTDINGDVCKGTFVNDLLSGPGKKTAKDGTVYEGVFVNGVLSGPGKKTAKDGTVYEGEFKNYALNGEGKIIYTDGKILQGEFKNDVWVKGTIIGKDGEVYTGFSNEKLDGQGVKTMKNGDIVYQGEFKNGKLNGSGEIIDKYSDKTFKGQFVDDKLNGVGEKTMYGETYKGEFLNNELHCEAGTIRIGNDVRQFGKFLEGQLVEGMKKNGLDIYVGKFTDGLLNGEGWCKTPNYLLKGEFLNGELNGEGTYEDFSGCVFNGTFMHGKFHGKGKTTLEDGAVMNGDYSKGQFISGTYTNPDGTIYEGKFVFQELTGEGTETTKDGTVYKGNFIEGRLVGQGTKTTKEGQVHAGIFSYNEGKKCYEIT